MRGHGKIAPMPSVERGSSRGGAGSAGLVRSRCFAFGITAHELAVTIAWGSIDEAEARALGDTWQTTFDGPPRDTVIDIRHLARTDAGAFDAMRELLERHRVERARVVRRQAIVGMDDFGGVFVRGYLAMFPPPYEVRTVQTLDEALAWLGHPCCRGEIMDLAATREDGLARLRAWLETTRLADATIDRASAELGIPVRTLQRRLAAAGTRFTTELTKAQVSRAQQLMRDPRLKLADIAREAGCASPSPFSAMFRRITGESPPRWRR